MTQVDIVRAWKAQHEAAHVAVAEALGVRVGYATIHKKAHVKHYAETSEQAAIIALAGYYHSVASWPGNKITAKGDYSMGIGFCRAGQLNLRRIKYETRRLIAESWSRIEELESLLVEHGTVLFSDNRRTAAKIRGAHYRERWARSRQYAGRS